MIKIGDTVQVTNWGAEYTTDYDWFEKHRDVPLRYVICYAYDERDNYKNRRFTDDRLFKVLYVDRVSNKVLITLLENDNFDWAPGRVYLVGCEGIEPCCRSMTLEEIEQKLGYKIIIIDKKGDN